MRGEMQAAIEYRIMTGTTWMGVPALKMPVDAWVYQELVFELRPDVIVEVGNKHGGALLYLANVCDLVGHGRVVGVDVDHTRIDERVFEHRRVTLITGDALEVFPQVDAAAGGSAGLVIEDSAHTYEHTLAVMRLYSQLVPAGGYLVVEDGVMEGPARAIKAFMRGSGFVQDRAREWPVSWNPGGYLRRKP